MLFQGNLRRFGKRGVVALLTFLTLSLGSCSSVSDLSSSAPGEPAVRAYLLPVCPSATVETHGPEAILVPLAVSVVKEVLEDSVSWLSRVAKEDAQGKASSGQTPGFLWWYLPGANTSSPASCAVVVVSESSPADWCDKGDSPFSQQAAGVCSYFAKQRSLSMGSLQEKSARSGRVALPAFYAEINLMALKDGRGLAPRSVLYYYPDGIHPGYKRTARKRTLLVTVSAKKTAGDAEALSAVVALLRDVQPQNEIQAQEVDGDKWSQVLANQETPPANLAAGAAPVGMTAVNVSAEVREVGDPSKVIQLVQYWAGVLKDPLKSSVDNSVTKK
jgi:hypothetical protein